jgi:peptidyl-prolyl cis-trans isomerase A (cyclophilin A)
MKCVSRVLPWVLLIVALKSFAFLNAAAAANTIVQFDVTGIHGPNGPTSSFQVELFDTQTPITVANFLSYVGNHAYDNSIIHRNIPSLFVQGGGLNLTGTSSEESPTASPIGPIATDPPIQNEPGISNLRGTLAMARNSSPNSATSQWFFNMSDNTYLDYPNDTIGWTVFGRVLGSGMSVLDEINNTATYNITPPYSALGNDLQHVPLFQDNENRRFFITVASINVVPEPTVLTLLCAFSAGALAYTWRWRKAGV